MPFKKTPKCLKKYSKKYSELKCYIKLASKKIIVNIPAWYTRKSGECFQKSPTVLQNLH